MSAFTIYATLVWTTLDLTHPVAAGGGVASAAVRRALLPFSALVAVTATSGAFVAGAVCCIEPVPVPVLPLGAPFTLLSALVRCLPGLFRCGLDFWKYLCEECVAKPRLPTSPTAVFGVSGRQHCRQAAC